jgi:hypothetical protein
MPPVAPITDPFNAITELFVQTVPFEPALTTGADVMVITLLLGTALQLPLPVELSVSVTVPAAISAALGV